MSLHRLVERPTRRPRLGFPRLGFPRLGFLGLGWIGRNRMEALLAGGTIEVAGLADPNPDCAAAAGHLAPSAAQVGTLEDLLDLSLDGLVIATPSAQHAGQAIQALERGVAVFCQKPLGRTAAETRAVVDAARAADRLLAVDFSYRTTQAMRCIRERIQSDALGRIFAIDLVFHNAYGPDKSWFYNRDSSGGGCVIDLGVHLVDLALWTMNFPAVRQVSSSLFAGGAPLVGGSNQVEDYAIATLHLANDTIVRIACSWRLHAGCDAVISAAFHGTQGGATLRNANGSFYDFIAEHYQGSSCHSLATPPDAWSGRAVLDWAARVAAGEGFDSSNDRLVDVAGVVDRIYES